MRLIEVIRQPSANEIAEIRGFVDHITQATGTRPLSDHLWLDLTNGGSPGFIAVRISDSSQTIALAQISAAHESAALEVVLADDVDDATLIRDDAVETALDGFQRDGGGTITWWLDDPTPHDLDMASRLGLTPVRSLFEMRRPLPAPMRATIETRAFEPATDTDDWLAVNNRAFADHGEQGGWTAEMLALRMSEPWFDTTGFRIHEVDDQVAAFCWTKVHPATAAEPEIGEIYVIAVDPAFHGRGLGRQLTLAGLDSITDRGIATANLYVDADNEAAVGLYQTLGFSIHRTRSALAGQIPPLES